MEPPHERASVTPPEREPMSQDDDHGSAQYVMASLPETFGREELDAAIASLSDQGLTRGSGTTALDQIEHIAACNYSMEFSV